MDNEKMKQEALERMKILGLHQNVLDEFEKEGKLNLSDPGAALFWLNDKQQELVDSWESETGNLVYHVIQSHTEFGELLSFLYVSKHIEEWELDRCDLEACCPFCYVMNLDDDMCSEYGCIGIMPFIGGVLRIS